MTIHGVGGASADSENDLTTNVPLVKAVGLGAFAFFRSKLV